MLSFGDLELSDSLWVNSVIFELESNPGLMKVSDESMRRMTWDIIDMTQLMTQQI